MKMDLFNVNKGYTFAHCISSDCALGAGIAVEFQRRFDLRPKLLQYSEIERKHPTCLLVNGVFNLVTKEKYWQKPTYQSLTQSLYVMKSIIQNQNPNKFRFIAMPKIGCGLDKLKWDKVKLIIEKVFDDIDIEILVCYM